MDNYGYLWISTRKGLSKFTPQTETFKNYTNEDGILEGITYPGSFFESKRGEVFIGCGRGFIAFYPDSIIHNMQPPKIVITDFKVFNKSVKLPKSIVMLDKIELSHEQNFFSFEFSALDYTNPEMNQYAYKLTGIQKEWVYSGSRRYANYTNINPGKYTFQVIGANYEGAWSDSGASIKISVMPPYWMTSWFKMLLAFIFVTGIIALYKIRVSILKREKHIQQAFSRRLIEEIEKGRKRIAGELHDSLGQNLLFIKNEMQQIIGKLSNTNRAKDDLMNVSSLVSESINEIREISTNLHPHQLDRLGLKNAIESMARKFMHSIRIKILTDIDDLGKFAYETTEIHIFRIVQEALTNIIKHANATEVTITIKKKIKYSYISVKDNGVGFNYTKDQTENSIAKGFGLTGIAERVKILNGKLIIKSSENSGTDIQVIIPLK